MWVTGLLSALGSLVSNATEAVAGVALLAVSVSILSYIALGIAKFMLWVSAVIFNWSIETLVFGFSDILGNSTGMLTAWSLLRDFGNIILIFGFVYMGIQMVLNISHSSVGKTLPRMLLFAVLINFSLFAAETVVDTANGLTYGFYNQSVSGMCEGGTEKECRLNNGIAGQILDQMNMISVVWSYEDIDIGKDVAAYFTNPVGNTANFIVLAILVTAAAVVLFAGAFLFISRGITLAFLLVTSPIGFAGMAVPALNQISKQWWSALLKNAFFAPVFLILLFVGLKLTDGLREAVSGKNGLAGALLDGGAFNAGPLFLYVLVLGFLIAALTVAKSFSIIGADFAINAAERVATAPYLPARDFVGRRMEGMAKGYDRRAASAARMVNVLPKPLRGIAGGIAGGIARPFDDAIRGGLKMGPKISLPGHGSYLDDKKKREGRKHELDHAAHAEHLKHEIEEGLGDPAKLAKLATKLSINDWKHTPQFEEQAEGIAAIAKALPPNKFKQAMDDKDIPEETKDLMRSERFGGYDAIIADAASGSPTAEKTFKSMSGVDIGMSGVVADPTRRKNFAVMASDAQFEDVLKADIGEDVKSELRQIREGTGAGDRFDPVAPPGGVSNAEKTLGKLSSAKIAELPSGILEQPAVLSLLDVEDFNALAKADRLGKNAKRAAKVEFDAIRTNRAHPKYRRYQIYYGNLSPEQRGTLDSYYS